MFRVVSAADPDSEIRAEDDLTANFADGRHEFTFPENGIYQDVVIHVFYDPDGAATNPYPSMMLEWQIGPDLWSADPIADGTTVASSGATTTVEVRAGVYHLKGLNGWVGLPFTNRGGAPALRVSVKETGDTGHVGACAIRVAAVGRAP